MKHLLQARLISQAELETKMETLLNKAPTPKMSKIDAFDVMDQPDREYHYVTVATHELVRTNVNDKRSPSHLLLVNYIVVDPSTFPCINHRCSIFT